MDILEFTGDHKYLSNFYIVEFVWDGIIWQHSEAAYQAAKTLDRATRLEFSRMKPGESKRAGKTVSLRSDWEEVKYDIMHAIVLAKFKQNPHLAKLLLATGTAHLEEGNNHGDRIWGVCPPRSNLGHNLLGKILMDVRAEIGARVHQ